MNRPVGKILIFVPVLLVYIAGLGVDVMEVDAAQYAEMSREMLETGNYLHLYCRGNDYLDKPPFLFWVSSLSFALFGVSNAAYKLPSLLFTLLGVYATYRLGRKMYSPAVGFAAALILSTTQAWFQFTNDVRTDTILAGAVVFAIWQLKCYIDDKKWLNLFGAAAGIAIAMLTKGPIGLMVPLLAFATDLMLKRDWKTIFRWQWIVLLLLAFLPLIPMLWGLYTQFDLHPGKEVFGEKMGSGLRFYFWTQSFGRLTGESKWINDTSLTGFLPILGWAFLPWIVVLAGGLWQKTRELVLSVRCISPQQEFITLGGFVFPFIALSLSNYKLPHYIFVLFPLGAILSAGYIITVFEKIKKTEQRIHSFLIGVMLSAYIVVSGLLLFKVFTPAPVWKIIVPVITLLAGGYCILRAKGYKRFLLTGVTGAIVFNLVMNLHFYPELLKYQSPAVAGRMYYQQLQKEGYPVAAFRALGYSFDFYARQTMWYHEKPDVLKENFREKKVWVYTNDEGLKILKDYGIPILREIEFADYKVTHLSFSFLSPSSRQQVVKRKYMVLIHNAEKRF